MFFLDLCPLLWHAFSGISPHHWNTFTLIAKHPTILCCITITVTLPNKCYVDNYIPLSSWNTYSNKIGINICNQYQLCFTFQTRTNMKSKLLTGQVRWSKTRTNFSFLNHLSGLDRRSYRQNWVMDVWTKAVLSDETNNVQFIFQTAPYDRYQHWTSPLKCPIWLTAVTSEKGLNINSHQTFQLINHFIFIVNVLKIMFYFPPTSQLFMILHCI